MPPNNKSDGLGWQSAIKTWGALATALGAILALFFLLFPGLKPTGPAPNRRVTVSDIHVEDVWTDSVTIRFKAEVEGYRNTALSVMWNLYGDIVVLGARPSGRGFPTSQLKATAQREVIPGEITVPVLPGPEWRQIRIDILRADGTEVANGFTEKFQVPGR
jgi:hypothetical protein